MKSRPTYATNHKRSNANHKSRHKYRKWLCREYILRATTSPNRQSHTYNPTLRVSHISPNTNLLISHMFLCTPTIGISNLRLRTIRTMGTTPMSISSSQNQLSHNWNPSPKPQPQKSSLYPCPNTKSPPERKWTQSWTLTTRSTRILHWLTPSHWISQRSI